MEIETEKLKEALLKMFQTLRFLDTELYAYRFAIHMATLTGVIDPEVPWKETVAAAKENPLTVRTMAAKYDPVVRELIAAFDQIDGPEQLLEWLRKWKPTDPPN